MITNVLDSNINNIDAKDTALDLLNFIAGLALVIGVVLIIVGIIDINKYKQDELKKRSAKQRLIVGLVFLLLSVFFFFVFK